MVTKSLYNYFYDLLVEGILTLLVISPIIYGYLRLVSTAGEYYFITLQVFILVVTIVLAQIYPNIITPYFNKFKPIRDPALSLKIKNLAAKTAFPLADIKVKIDGKYD